MHHAPLAKAGGVSDEGMQVLATQEKFEAGNGGGKGLSEKQWAVVRYSDASTRGVEVSEELFEDLRRHFSNQEIVEITATVSEAYFLYCILAGTSYADV